MLDTLRTDEPGLADRQTDSLTLSHGEPATPETPRPLPHAGDVLAGRFVVGRRLGGGSSGDVFEAYDEALQTRVAVKVLRASQVGAAEGRRLLREVRLARPGHPDLAAVHDVHWDGEVALLSMELVEGRNLASALAERGRLPVEDVISIGRHVAGALAFLASRDLVHRDVKPANILLTGHEGSAKLCDLGLVRPILPGETVTASALVVGTPNYMAPEQAVRRELTPAVDVYALGLTLFECLTGEVPLKGTTAVETLVLRQGGRPRPARTVRPDCPAWLERLLSAMLEPRPEERPAASRVVGALESRQVRRRVRPRSLLAVAAGAGAVALGLTVARSTGRAAPAARVEVVRHAVEGLDTSGRSTWRHVFESRIQASASADLDGDGEDETIVAAYPAGDAPAAPRDAPREPPHAEVAAFTRRGEVVTRVRVEDLLTSWPHRFTKRVHVSLAAKDLDGDGRPELLVVYRHRSFYPSGLVVYWPSARRWDWPLDHTGHIYDVDVKAGQEPRLRLLAVNNRLGMLPVVMELRLRGPHSEPADFHSSGPMLAVTRFLDQTGSGAWFHSYLLLPSQGSVRATEALPTIREASGGGLAIRGGFGDHDLDGFMNPTTSPNAGNDLRELRLAFLRGALPDHASEPASGRHVDAELAAVRARFGPLLAEGPYDALTRLAFARRFALAGERAKSIALLRDAIASPPYEDVTFALSQALALDGQTAEALRMMKGLANNPRTPRGDFDARVALFRMGIDARNPTETEHALGLLVRRLDLEQTQPSCVPALRALARLMWDSVVEGDTTVRSSDFAPEGSAVAALARWRLGRTTVDDVEAMRQLAASTPDARSAANVATAAAQIATGRPREALAVLEEAVGALRPESVEDLGARQVLHLAQGLQALALLRSGREKEAVDAATELARVALPGLLPQILARAVIESAAGGAPGARRSGT